MNDFAGGKPQLKKIKRPINRMAPQTNARPSGPVNSSISSSIVSQPPSEIDNYLDEPSLPSRNIRKPAFPEETARVPNPQYLDESAYEEEIYPTSANETPEWLNMKVFVFIIIVSFFVGIVSGKLLFAEAKVVRNGLQGVVVNTEVPRGRARCGVAERTQGCVLYIMNPQRQDMHAKDFYDLASQMTGRQRFMIETGNMRYANSKIKPGDIVQLNIPPL